jgi:hypothetical protein
MKKVVIGLIVGFATFSVGIFIGSRTRVRPNFQPPIKLSGLPCRESLLSIEPQDGVPIRLIILNSRCASPHSAEVQVVAENIGTEVITRFEIGGIGTYDRPVTGRKGVNIVGSKLAPHQTTTGIVETDTLNDETSRMLTRFTLLVWSITYADGKTWNHPPHNKSLDASGGGVFRNLIRPAMRA